MTETLPILDEADEQVRMRKLGLQGTMHPLRQRKAVRVAELLNHLEAACKGDATRFAFCVKVVRACKMDHEKTINGLITDIHTGKLFGESPPVDTTGMTRQQKRAALRKAKKVKS